MRLKEWEKAVTVSKKTEVKVKMLSIDKRLANNFKNFLGILSPKTEECELNSSFSLRTEEADFILTFSFQI